MTKELLDEDLNKVTGGDTTSTSKACVYQWPDVIKNPINGELYFLSGFTVLENEVACLYPAYQEINGKYEIVPGSNIQYESIDSINNWEKVGEILFK